MTPGELRQIKEEIGFETDTDLADALGYGREQVNNWKNGNSDIPQAVAYLLRLWNENPNRIPESKLTT